MPEILVEGPCVHSSRLNRCGQPEVPVNLMARFNYSRMNKSDSVNNNVAWQFSVVCVLVKLLCLWAGEFPEEVVLNNKKKKEEILYNNCDIILL